MTISLPIHALVPPIPYLPDDSVKTDIMRLVESARKAKAPIVGIPIPGERPFCIRGELLRESLKGMRITEASIQRPLPGTEAKHYLLLFCASDDGRIKGSRKYVPVAHEMTWNHSRKERQWRFNHQRYSKVQEQIYDWAEARREKLQQPKLKGDAAKLQKLQAKLQKITYRPTNPALASGEAETSEYVREEFCTWRNERPIRRTFKTKERFEMAAINREQGVTEFSNPAKRYGFRSDWGMPKWGRERYDRVLSDTRSDVKEQIKALAETITGRKVIRVSAFGIDWANKRITTAIEYEEETNRAK